MSTDHPTVDPHPEQLPALLASLPPATPIVMLNLLRFRAVATYDDGRPAISGREAYALYAAIAGRKVRDVGGGLVYAGEVQTALIGPADEAWDEMLLVRYPSREAFAAMLAMPDYREAARHRSAALLDARLIATVERVPRSRNN